MAGTAVTTTIAARDSAYCHKSCLSTFGSNFLQTMKFQTR